MTTKTQVQIITMKEAVALTTLSRATIYRLLKNDNFPQPVKLSSNRRGFLIEDIEEWISNMPSRNGGNH